MPSEKAPGLDVLRTFLAVYRTGSFTSAAKQLAVTQPTVTNHIAQLERTLGRELFIRSGGGTRPTALAHEMAAGIGEHLDHIERFFVEDVTGKEMIRALHIGGPMEFVTEFFLPVLAPHVSELPRMEFIFDVAENLINELSSGRLDLIVSTIQPRKDGITAWPIMDEEFLLVASPDIAGRVVGEGPERFARIPMLSYDRKLPIIRRYWKTVFGHPAEVGPATLLPNLLAVKSAATLGYGVTVLPHYLILDELASGALVPLDEPETPPLNTLFLAAQSATLTRHSKIMAAAELIRHRIRAHQQTPARRHKNT